MTEPVTGAVTEIVHAVGVAVGVDADGPLAGALILGPAGAGKSSLAIALIGGCPWRRTRLVADDVVELGRVGAALIARAPAAGAPAARGRLEIRGFGPAPAPSIEVARLRVVFDLAASSPRLPVAGVFERFGVNLPVYPFPIPVGAAPDGARARLILRALIAGQTP